MCLGAAAWLSPEVRLSAAEPDLPAIVLPPEETPQDPPASLEVAPGTVVEIQTKPVEAIPLETLSPGPAISAGVRLAESAITAALSEPRKAPTDASFHPAADLPPIAGESVERANKTEDAYDVILGQPRVLVLNRVPSRMEIIAVGRDPIAELKPMNEANSDGRGWRIVGKKPGTGILNIWFDGQNQPTGYLLRVVADPRAQAAPRPESGRVSKVIKDLVPLGHMPELTSVPTPHVAPAHVSVGTAQPVVVVRRAEVVGSVVAAPIAPPPPTVVPAPPAPTHIDTALEPLPEPTMKTPPQIEGTAHQDNILTVGLGRSRVIPMKKPARMEVPCTDDGFLVEVKPVAGGKADAKDWSVTGKTLGSGMLHVWFDDDDKPVSYLVHVVADVPVPQPVKTDDGTLLSKLNEAFPDCHIALMPVGDKVILSGQAKDVETAMQILRRVRSSGSEEGVTGAPLAAATLPPTDLQVEGNPAAALTTCISDFATAGGPKVINKLRVPDEQQVQLKVQVAQVSCAAAHTVGIEFPVASGAEAARGNVPVLQDNGRIAVALNVLKGLGHARSLAEPTLIAVTGQAASISSRGRLSIVSNWAPAGPRVAESMPVTIQLNCRPIVIERDHVRLEITGEVSAHDSMSKRSLASVLDLRPGQAVALCALAQGQPVSPKQGSPTLAPDQEIILLVTPVMAHMEHDKQADASARTGASEPLDGSTPPARLSEQYLLRPLSGADGRGNAQHAP